MILLLDHPGSPAKDTQQSDGPNANPVCRLQPIAAVTRALNSGLCQAYLLHFSSPFQFPVQFSIQFSMFLSRTWHFVPNSPTQLFVNHV